MGGALLWWSFHGAGIHATLAGWCAGPRRPRAPAGGASRTHRRPFPSRADLLDEAKVGILAGSLAAGVVGALVLLATPRLPAR